MPYQSSFLPQADGSLREVVHDAEDQHVPEHAARIAAIRRRVATEGATWPRSRQLTIRRALALLNAGKDKLNANPCRTVDLIAADVTFDKLWAVRVLRSTASTSSTPFHPPLDVRVDTVRRWRRGWYTAADTSTTGRWTPSSRR